MKKLLLFTILMGILYIPKSYSQLAKGDIAFIGYNTDSGPAASADHSFSFITLTDIPANEVIYFTEEGWNDVANTWIGNIEGHIKWTAPGGGISCGTVIYIAENGSTDAFTISGGGTATLASGASWNLLGGDQVLAYQASTAKPATLPTFISGINGDDGGSNPPKSSTSWNDASFPLGSAGSGLPFGLTNGVDCVSLFVTQLTEQDNAKYLGSLTGTSTELRALINNRLNWGSDNSTPFDITPSAYAPSVTCVAPCSEPDVPTVSQTGTVCMGSEATLNISGNLNDATNWHIYSDAAGTVSVGTTATSTFNVTPTATTTYYVRGEGGCTTPASFGNVTVTVTPLDDASFVYSSAAYCANDTDPTPTVTGLAGGTFTSTAGLSINGSTGAVDVSASTPGTYTITYTTAGTCPNSATKSVTINTIDDASFSYDAAAYCANSADPTPTITGLAGGTFSSTAGLSINVSTGVLDVSASTPGNYIVTYTTAGTCTNNSNLIVTINAIDDASFNYDAAAYCVDSVDPTPTITGLVGGTFSSTAGLSIDASTGVLDVSASTPGTYTVTYTTAGTCTNNSGVSVTINALDDASFSYDAAAYCADSADPTPTITGLAGGTFSSTAGLSINASTGVLDVSASTPGTYTVTYTTAGTCTNSSGVSVTINALDDASFSYDASSYTANDADPTPTITGLAGGTFSSTAGLNISASTGEIDLSASTLGTYTVMYTTAGSCPNTSIVSVTIVTSDITWTGTTNNDFHIPSNWNTNTVPTTTSDITIPNGLTNYPTASTAVTFNSLTINSGASFIPQSTVNGPVTYKRNLPTTNWYLVAAPVNGETQQDVIANHTFATGAGSNLGIGSFSNNTGPSWIYSTASSTGTIPSGFGVSMKLAAPGDVSMTGNINTSNIAFPISQGTRNHFNLLGNPYTAYINSAVFAADNSAIENATFWLWDGAQYQTYNNVSPINIAPAQGFFVEANTNTNVIFTTANQSHQNTDTFMRQAPNSNFELLLEANKTKVSTKVFYVKNKTTGFDSGYDSKMFDGIVTEFSIYTELVSNNEGENLAIQTLPDSGYEEMVVPVGVKALAGKEITFSINASNFSSDLKIFLEDKVTNTFTQLNKANSTYKVTLDETLNGIGRFYIHTTNSTLSVATSKNLENISLYKLDNTTLRIAGLPQGNANITVYDILGKQIMKTTFTSIGVKDVFLPQLPKAVYLVKLETEKGKINKKIVIE